MSQPEKILLQDLVAQADAIEAAITLAVRDALLLHKRAGNPIAVWQNGQVVWIPPEEIPVKENDANPRTK